MHVLNQLNLQLVATLFVARNFALLGQHWHVVTAFFHPEASKLDDHIELLEVRELLERNDLFLFKFVILLSWKRVMRPVSQNNLEEDLG